MTVDECNLHSSNGSMVTLASSDVSGVDYHVPHANIHSCVSSAGACVPFVGAQPGESIPLP